MTPWDPPGPPRGAQDVDFPEPGPGRRQHLRFVGRIAGMGSTSGVRVVLGVWRHSPFGAFVDAMVENAAGHRVLVAPSPQVASFVAQTYVFDEVRTEQVAVTEEGASLVARSASLALHATVGGRTPLGWALRGIPSRVGSSPAFAAAADPVARVLLRGVRTRGTARSGRREWYAARDMHALTSLAGTWDGHDLGSLAPVDPPCHFGFSSTPRMPAITRVTTTVEIMRRDR